MHISRVLDALRSRGVGGRDVQTEEASVQAIRGKGGRITGYFATNRVFVFVQQLGKLGDLVAGTGPTFLITNGDRVYGRALDAAFAKARAKAHRLALRASVRLGRPVAILEGEAPQPFSGGPALAEQAFAPPFEAGQLTVGGTVTITYAIR